MTDKSTKRTPALRFPEFTGEWEEKRLGEISKINPSSPPLPSSFNYIDLESVCKGVLSSFQVLNKDEAPSRAQRVLKNGDIIFQTVRPYQQNNYLFNTIEDEVFVASTGYAQLRSKIDNHYLYYSLHSPSFTKTVITRCTGSNYPAISTGDLATIYVSYPMDKEEQSKIADFLGAVDRRLELLGERREQLEEYKRGVMQQIFSQKIRFKDQNGNQFPEWEEKRLGDVFKITRGNVLAVPKMSQIKKEPNIYPVYSSQTKDSGLTGYYDEYLYEDAITWTTDGANAGEVKFRKGKFYCTNVCGVLLNKEGYANQCIAEIFNMESRRYVSYVGNPKLMNNVVAIIKLFIPASLAEQQKIADFLSAIDQKIERAQSEIDNLEEYKKGLLQQMFV